MQNLISLVTFTTDSAATITNMNTNYDDNYNDNNKSD